MEMKNIYSAFVKAQTGFAPALKTSTNPHFKSKYADLAACVEAVVDSLNANGIGLVQRSHPDDTGVAVETVFVHESGESFGGGIFRVPAAKQDPQGYGSALSYARRYSLMAACGIAPEDDDGNAGSKPATKTVKPPAPAVGMSQTNLADWLQVLASCAPDEIEGMLRDGLAAATEVKDKEAFVAIRNAGKKRQEAMAVTV